MYRPIPADWLSPWGDKQEGQLTEDTWSGKLFYFIWICLALQFSRKVKGGSKMELLLQLEIWEIAFAGEGNSESYFLSLIQSQWPRQQADMLLTHNMLVAKRKWRKFVWRPWRFRPSFVESAKWMCTKRSERGRYHCIRPASIRPLLDTFAAAGGCSKES